MFFDWNDVTNALFYIPFCDTSLALSESFFLAVVSIYYYHHNDGKVSHMGTGWQLAIVFVFLDGSEMALLVYTLLRTYFYHATAFCKLEQ